MELTVLDVGEIKFKKLEAMHQELAQKRKKGEIPDTLIVAMHPPTITTGGSNGRNVIHATPQQLNEYGIEKVDSIRAGGASYLGPGQLCFYPVFDLSGLKTGPQNFLREMEGITNMVANDFGAPTFLGKVYNPKTRKDYNGVWFKTGEKYNKLFSIGIHTMSLNGVIDNGGFSVYLSSEAHRHFDLIDHCGFNHKEVGAISIGEITGKVPDHHLFRDKIVKGIAKRFGYAVNIEDVQYVN